MFWSSWFKRKPKVAAPPLHLTNAEVYPAYNARNRVVRSAPSYQRPAPPAPLRVRQAPVRQTTYDDDDNFSSNLASVAIADIVDVAADVVSNVADSIFSSDDSFSGGGGDFGGGGSSGDW